MSLRSIRVLTAVPLLWLTSICAMAQSSPQLLGSSEAITIRSVQMIQAPDGPAVEILSTRPVVPGLQKLLNPARLVIDLPNSIIPASRKPIDFKNDQVRGVRINQFQTAPTPVVRVVVDLATPAESSWDAAGNRLMVRLHASAQATAKPTSIPSLKPAPTPVIVPVTTESVRDVSIAGAKVLPGSSVTAGADTAIVQLGRGGEVRVCPGTTVTVTSSQNGHALMLGMNTGALETHYYLDAAADSIMTPDFRIQLPGPGEFHYAVSADARGNTCVRALPGNTASVIVSELLGDGTYQVKPSDQLFFHAGKLTNVDSSVPLSCGCPPPSIPVNRAATPPLPPEPPVVAANIPPAIPGTERSKETAPLPVSKPNDVHVEVEAPFVFNGNDPPPPEPAPTREAERLPLRPLHVADPSAALPAAQLQVKEARHGFFGKIRGFFSSLFS